MDIASSNRAKIVTALLAGLAVALSALLLYQSQTQDALPGCGGGSGCGAVLTSRWAYWFGIPVSLPAMLLYTTMLSAVAMRDPISKRPQRPAVFIMAICAIAAMFAAAWFISVQLLILKELCKYCLATHAVGVIASVLCLAVASAKLSNKALTQSSLSGLLLVCVLAAGQILGEPPQAPSALVQYADDLPVNPDADPLTIVPPSNVTAPKPESTTSPATQPAGPAPVIKPPIKQSTPETVSLIRGRVKVDLTDAPILGNTDAEHVLVCMFDYTCVHCRKTRGMLEKAQKKYGDSLAIVCLPVPLDRKCNYLIKRRNYANRFACDMAQISLAFWKVSPEKWAEFDRQLYSNANILTPVLAKAAAVKLIDEIALKQAMQDTKISQRIAKDVQLYRQASGVAKNSSIPILLSKSGVINGTPSPVDLDNFIKGQPITKTPANQPRSH